MKGSNERKYRVPRGMRRLEIRGETWHWRYGRQISIRDPHGVGHQVTVEEILGMTSEDVEDARYDRRLSVEPSRVVDHIDRCIAGYTDRGGFPAGSRWAGHQAQVRDGWIGFEGPRGTWQAKPGVWHTSIRSPEDVETSARTYDVLDMPLDDWVGIKIAHMKEQGTSLDQLRIEDRRKPYARRTNPVELLMEYDAPAIPVPNAASLARFVREVVTAAPAAKTA